MNVTSLLIKAIEKNKEREYCNLLVLKFRFRLDALNFCIEFSSKIISSAKENQNFFLYMCGRIINLDVLAIESFELSLHFI